MLYSVLGYDPNHAHDTSRMRDTYTQHALIDGGRLPFQADRLILLTDRY